MIVNHDAVDALATALAAAPGITTASANPAEVRAPGVYLRHTGYSLDLLGGYTIRLDLHLVVPDTGYLRSRDALGALLGLVVDVIDPDGDVVPQGLVLPGSPAPLPGLRFPVNLHIEH